MSGRGPAVRVVTPPGHAPQVWAARLRRAPRIDVAALADLVRRRLGEMPALVVVSAHPDDETLGAGRLAYDWGRVSAVHALVASDGEACLDHVGPRPPGLAARRHGEWHQALDRLGVRRRAALHLPDGRLAEHEDAMITGLATFLADLGERPVVLAAPYARDPHPDHAAVGRAVAAVAGARGTMTWGYPIWMTYWSDPDIAMPDEDLIAVACSEDADRAHEEATATFVSQVRPLAEDLTAVVPAAMLHHQRRQLLIVDRALGLTRSPSDVVEEAS